MANNISEPVRQKKAVQKTNRVADHDQVFREAIDSQIALTKATARHEQALSAVAKFLNQSEELNDF